MTIPVLCYHSVNETYNDELDSLHPAVFESHLRFLVESYSIVPLRDVAEHLKTGRALPPNAVSITFDDGYRDNYEVVLPLLEKYEVHATIFVVPDFINNNVNLINEPGWEAISWDQL